MTYASDSKHHCRQVLSLCNCLDKNGFSCCVDVNARHDSPDQLQAMRDWCGRKFKEVAFICVCFVCARVCVCVCVCACVCVCVCVCVLEREIEKRECLHKRVKETGRDLAT